MKSFYFVVVFVMDILLLSYGYFDVKMCLYNYYYSWDMMMWFMVNMKYSNWSVCFYFLLLMLIFLVNEGLILGMVMISVWSCSWVCMFFLLYFLGISSWMWNEMLLMGVFFCFCFLVVGGLGFVFLMMSMLFFMVIWKLFVVVFFDKLKNVSLIFLLFFLIFYCGVDVGGMLGCMSVFVIVKM